MAALMMMRNKGQRELPGMLGKMQKRRKGLRSPLSGMSLIERLINPQANAQANAAAYKAEKLTGVAVASNPKRKSKVLGD